MFGTPVQQQQEQQQGEQPPAGPSSTSSSSSHYQLDGCRVCLQYARKLLKQQRVWPLSGFIAAWQQEVPGGCWCPDESMLAGQALIMEPEPAEGKSSLSHLMSLWHGHLMSFGGHMMWLCHMYVTSLMSA